MYGVSGEVCWRVGKGCGEGSGEDVGKCVEVWGPNTLLIPHISLPSRPHLFLHLPLPPPHPITLSYTSFYTSSLLPPPTPQHIFLLSPHLPSPSQSVAKLPCDEVSVAKLLWRSYHVAKLLATIKTLFSTAMTRQDKVSAQAFLEENGCNAC